jgi:serine/threonine protein kinase
MQPRDSQDRPAAGSAANYETGAGGGYVVEGKIGTFKPGDIIGGSYEIIEQLGRGAMGMVFRAKHVSMGTQYALKVLSAEQLTDVGVRRFQNEAQAIAKLSHPNVIAIYNFGLHEGQLPFYVMDLLKGENLLDKVMEYGPMPLNHAMATFIEVCAGLGYAHRKGILHRDVKPANIVILDNPDVHGARVKVVDFGIVKFAEEIKPDAQKLTAMGDVCGSPTYMSPEQASGAKVDPRSDIYSLGCSLYECLTGTLPFRGRNPMETMMMHHSTPAPSLKTGAGGKEFPDQVEYLVAKMLQKEPMDRYQSMDSVAQDLKNILLQMPMGTPQDMGQGFGQHPSAGGATTRTTFGGASTVTSTTQNTSANLFGTSAPSGVKSTSSGKPNLTPAQEISLRFNSRATLNRNRNADEDDRFKPSNEEYDYEAAPAGFNAVKMLLIPLIAVGLLGGMAYFVWQALQPKEQVPIVHAEAPVVPEISDTLGAAKGYLSDPEHIDLPKQGYFSSRIKENGQEFIEFKFPAVLSGKVVVAVMGLPEVINHQTLRCAGTLKYPANEKLGLYPTGSAEANPEFFDRFRPGEIYELGFNYPSDTDKAFRAAFHLKNFPAMRLNNCMQETTALAPDFAALTGLKKLEVTGGSLNGAFFAKMPWITNLEFLGMSDVHELTPLCAKMAESRKLKTLFLQRCKLTSKDYSMIAQIPSVEILSLCNSQVDKEELRSLSKMRNLKTLDIAENKLGVEVAPIIRQFPSLKKLILSKDNMGYKDFNDAVSKWHEVLPNLEIKIK